MTDDNIELLTTVHLTRQKDQPYPFKLCIKNILNYFFSLLLILTMKVLLGNLGKVS